MTTRRIRREVAAPALRLRRPSPVADVTVEADAPAPEAVFDQVSGPFSRGAEGFAGRAGRASRDRG
jgi:hypothetical protein